MVRWGSTQTVLPAVTDTSIRDPYSHGYMYGGSAFALVDIPYPPDVQAAAKAGTLAAHRLHPPELVLCHSGRGSHLHRRRTRHLDPSAG